MQIYTGCSQVLQHNVNSNTSTNKLRHT